MLEVKYQLIGCFEGLCSEDLDDSAVDSLHYVPTDGASDCREARNVDDVENWRPLVMQQYFAIILQHYCHGIQAKNCPQTFIEDRKNPCIKQVL
jgi:hypothetical protein|tara:strand:+ start:86 stop:367 length:282 start_codon:yes stop_codon:yes gene_type:complete